jgi:hypothetical protein
MTNEGMRGRVAEGGVESRLKESAVAGHIAATAAVLARLAMEAKLDDLADILLIARAVSLEASAGAQEREQWEKKAFDGLPAGADTHLAASSDALGGAEMVELIGRNLRDAAKSMSAIVASSTVLDHDMRIRGDRIDTTLASTDSLLRALAESLQVE